MALNSNLVGLAGVVITAAGSYSAYLPGTPACKIAIQGGIESTINSACGPFFGNGGLAAIIIVGGVVLIFITPFGTDIAGFVLSLVSSEKK